MLNTGLETRTKEDQPEEDGPVIVKYEDWSSPEIAEEIKRRNGYDETE